MIEREIAGVKVFVSGEIYNEYKGTLQEQLEEKDKEITRLNNIIDELEKENMYLDNEIGKLNNIVDTLEKTFMQDNKKIKEYNIEHPERPLDNYSRYYLDKLKELKSK